MASSQELSTPEARADARERLLDAADRLMWERGYESVGVAELCAAAGAPKGSFYYWWPSKQALALAMLERSWERVKGTVIVPAFTAPGTLSSRIDRYAAALEAALGHQWVERACVGGCRFGNFAAELSNREPEIRAALQRTFREMCAVFAAAISEARDSGEVPPAVDPVEGAEALCAHMEGLMILAKARHDPSMLRRLGPDARRLLGIGPQASLGAAGQQPARDDAGIQPIERMEGPDE